MTASDGKEFEFINEFAEFMSGELEHIAKLENSDTLVEEGLGFKEELNLQGKIEAILFAVVATQAGRTLGIDGWLAKRFGQEKWWLW